MMKQFYVIKASGGGHSDAWESVKFVTDDEVKGQAYVTYMNDFATTLKAIRKEVNDAMNEWRAVNPRHGADWTKLYYDKQSALKAAYPKAVQRGLALNDDECLWEIESVEQL